MNTRDHNVSDTKRDSANAEGKRNVRNSNAKAKNEYTLINAIRKFLCIGKGNNTPIYKSKLDMQSEELRLKESLLAKSLRFGSPFASFRLFPVEYFRKKVDQRE